MIASARYVSLHAVADITGEGGMLYWYEQNSKGVVRREKPTPLSPPSRRRLLRFRPSLPPPAASPSAFYGRDPERWRGEAGTGEQKNRDGTTGAAGDAAMQRRSSESTRRYR